MVISYKLSRRPCRSWNFYSWPFSRNLSLEISRNLPVAARSPQVSRCFLLHRFSASLCWTASHYTFKPLVNNETADHRFPQTAFTLSCCSVVFPPILQLSGPSFRLCIYSRTRLWLWMHISRWALSTGSAMSSDCVSADTGSSRSAYVNGSIWALGALASTFLSLRIYCKLRRRRGLWWDDYLLFLSWVSDSLASSVPTAAPDRE